jgi:hypothetical protein
VFLAWAGNRAAGLERAFIARPYIDRDDKLCWLGPIEELDSSEGMSFALPGVEDDKEPRRHSLDFAGISDIPVPPAFGLELLDADAHLDPARLFAEDFPAPGPAAVSADAGDTDEDDQPKERDGAGEEDDAEVRDDAGDGAGPGGTDEAG